MDRTDQKIDVWLTRPKSQSVRYQLIDKWGFTHGEFEKVEDAARWAFRQWPQQEQDEYRTGKGWDVQVVGAGR